MIRLLILPLLFISFKLQASENKELSFYKTSSNVFTHEFDTNLVFFKNGAWYKDEVLANMEEAAETYAQCGIKINIKNIKEVNHSADIYFDLEGYTDPDDIRPENSALNLANTFADPEVVTIYFMRNFTEEYNRISATAVPPIRVQYPDQKPVLNTIWMSFQVEYGRRFTQEEGAQPNGYSVLAHELGHILANTNHVDDMGVFNLMHSVSSHLSADITSEQCDQMKKSPLIKPIPNALQGRICPEITSPLRGKIVFLDGEEDCASTNKIINLLDTVIDNTSDLYPVSGIDFYLQQSRLDFIYADRDAIEGSLKPYYDHRLEFELPFKQAKHIWIHELGHALFNAQLKQDWKWFKGRLDIFEEWGRLIRLSYDESVNQTEVSSNVRQQIMLYRKYPHVFDIDEMVTPYQELFADTLAIIHSEDPKVMVYALSHPQDLLGETLSEQEKLYLHERDFSVEIQAENWDITEVHGLLAPSRFPLWKAIEHRLTKGDSKKVILRRIYYIIMNEIKTRYRDNSLWEMKASDVNKRLIKKIQERLLFQGISFTL